MTTDGQPLPTARPARGSDFTPDPAPYPFASNMTCAVVNPRKGPRSATITRDRVASPS